MLHILQSKLSQSDSKDFYPPAYGGFNTWESHVRYNNRKYMYDEERPMCMCKEMDHMLIIVYLAGH